MKRSPVLKSIGFHKSPYSNKFEKRKSSGSKRNEIQIKRDKFHSMVGLEDALEPYTKYALLFDKRKHTTYQRANFNVISILSCGRITLVGPTIIKTSFPFAIGTISIIITLPNRHCNHDRIQHSATTLSVISLDANSEH